MEQTNLTNTEDSPQETRHLGDEEMHVVDETFRPLQTKLDAVDEFILELQRKLEVEEELSHNLQTKVDHEQQLNRELSSELRKVLDERNSMKAILSKEREMLQLKCLEMEQRLLKSDHESAEKTPQESSHETDDPTTNANLKKLGLTEEILLALPFGYATKVRSAFEKLSYENEKLSKENAELRKMNATQAREIEQLKGERNGLYEEMKN